MIKNYKIKSQALTIKDEASVKFHIESGDYFGTIATILSLIEQEIKDNQFKNAPRIKKALKNLEKDLLLCQKDYQINIKLNQAKDKKQK